MPLRLLALCLMFGCAHPRVRSGTPHANPPATAAASIPDTSPAAPPAAVVLEQPLDFTQDVRPILESRCQPCHFTGGRMYERLPFDRPETIRHLGDRLFTRIKAENEQAMIRRFLAQEQ